MSKYEGLPFGSVTENRNRTRLAFGGGPRDRSQNFTPTNLESAPGLQALNEVGFAKLGPLVVPFYPFLGEGSPTKIDYRKKSGTLILSSLLVDLERFEQWRLRPPMCNSRMDSWHRELGSQDFGLHLSFHIPSAHKKVQRDSLCVLEVPHVTRRFDI